MLLYYYNSVALQWLKNDFLMYLTEWAEEDTSSGVSKKEKQKLCLSRETMDGLRITGI